MTIKRGMFEPQASFASASNIYGEEGTCHRQAGALGSFSFGSVFFVDTKKMNSAGGPNPAGLSFDFFQRKQTKQGRGVAPRTSLYSFVHHKRANRKRCPGSLPLRFPPLHYTLQRRKKLACGSNIFLRIPVKFRFIPATSHGIKKRVGNKG